MATFLKSSMDDLKTGTSKYMGMYPEKSTDGGKLDIANTVFA
jgi:hypothetical protein